MSKRHKARIVALNLLFESSIRDLDPIALLAQRGVGDIMEGEYATALVEGVVKNQISIDSAITSYAQGWELDRMPAIDRAIARLATYEILYHPEIDPPIVIDEALKLAGEFSSESSAAFLNGLLGRILVVREVLL
jgi:transcription antitermination protein NusB